MMCCIPKWLHKKTLEDGYARNKTEIWNTKMISTKYYIKTRDKTRIKIVKQI